MSPPIDIEDETERLSPAGEDAEWWLVVVEDARSVAHRLPRGAPVTIGRSEDCQIRIEHPSISRRHAQLLVGPPVCIQDLGAANGVRVGRRPIERLMLTPVEPGQAIELGAVLCVVHRPSMLPPGTVRAEGVSTPREDERPSMLPGGPALVRDPAMIEVMELAGRVAASELTVLLIGETGVGKELVAEALHKGSRRADGPLIRVNCAALAESVAESELFGHERGAFTGALQTRAGIFEAADGGTVFLDEIGELPLTLQAKLLRVLESREVTRLGSVTPRRVDVRFVSATNRDLAREVSERRFREDLYFRLNGIRIDVPPLRERRADIVPLAHRFARRSGGGVTLSAAAISAIERYAWPGNVRELKNAMERAVVLAGQGIVELTHLPPEIRGEARDATPGEERAIRSELEDVERRRILEALEETGGNQTRAAALIGMPRRTFVKRLAAYGIERPRKDKREGP
ncbi:MAG: sigma 54-interacting transcriptional regulator [Sandaracinaceae bacterium]